MGSRHGIKQQKGAPMTISSSLSAGVAGLNANATRLATIADNIIRVFEIIFIENYPLV